MRVTSLLDIPLTLITEQEINRLIDSFLSRNRCHHIVTANPEILVHASRNREYWSILKHADLVTADGIGIIVVLKLKSIPIRYSERLTGVTLTQMLLARAEQQRLSVLIVLPSNVYSPLDTMSRAIHDQYPTLSFTLAIDGTTPLEDMVRFQPQIIFVAHGAPQQERWIHDHITNFPSAKIAVGVGGTFDFISGTIRRAPTLLQRVGLEWFWRLLHEPRRFKRIVRAVVVFPYVALRHK